MLLFIFGSNSYRKKERLQFLKNAFLKKFDMAMLAVHTFDLEEDSFETVEKIITA